MFKKESLIENFIGFKVKFSTGEVGIIESKFGKTGKIKVYINNISQELKNLNMTQNTVQLVYKQYLSGNKYESIL